MARNLFDIIQVPFGICRPILNKAFYNHWLLRLEIFLDKLLLGQGFLPSYLFKVQFQDFNEFETVKLIKGLNAYKGNSFVPI